VRRVQRSRHRQFPPVQPLLDGGGADADCSGHFLDVRSRRVQPQHLASGIGQQREAFGFVHEPISQTTEIAKRLGAC
jgi:hypothetical protein